MRLKRLGFLGACSACTLFFCSDVEAMFRKQFAQRGGDLSRLTSVQKLSKENEHLAERVTREEKEKQEALNKVKGLNEVFTDHDKTFVEQAKELQDNLRVAREAAGSLIAQRDDQALRNSLLRKKSEFRLSQLINANSNVLRLTSLIDENNAKIKKLENLTDEKLRSDLEEAKKTLETEKTALETEKQNLTDQLNKANDEKNAEIEKLRSDLEEAKKTLETEKTARETEKQTLTDQLNKANDEKNAEIEKLTNDLAEANKKALKAFLLGTDQNIGEGHIRWVVGVAKNPMEMTRDDVADAVLTTIVSDEATDKLASGLKSNKDKEELKSFVNDLIEQIYNP